MDTKGTPARRVARDDGWIAAGKGAILRIRSIISHSYTVCQIEAAGIAAKVKIIEMCDGLADNGRGTAKTVFKRDPTKLCLTATCQITNSERQQ
jgi:hypothetical protein